MTFPEVIDALIPIYEEGMKAKQFKTLERLRIDDGICFATKNGMIDLARSPEFQRYKPKQCREHYWFPHPYMRKHLGYTLSEIIDTCIRPRLELLKRIQKDLQTKES